MRILPRAAGWEEEKGGRATLEDSRKKRKRKKKGDGERGAQKAGERERDRDKDMVSVNWRDKEQGRV